MKPLEEFYPHPTGFLAAMSQCKVCHRRAVRAREQRPEVAARKIEREAEYRADPKRRRRAKDVALRHRTGVTLAEKEQAVAAQGGACAICREALTLSRRTHVDHCHRTGRFRGVLCHHCNTGIGLFRDDPERLRRAAEYLFGHD